MLHCVLKVNYLVFGLLWVHDRIHFQNSFVWTVVIIKFLCNEKERDKNKYRQSSALHGFLTTWFSKIKFIYSEKATKFCEIFTLLLTVCTVVKSKVKISQNFVVFSEYMNFTTVPISVLTITFRFYNCSWSADCLLCIAFKYNHQKWMNCPVKN